MKKFVFELCAESAEAARAGEAGGADRIELCTQLIHGGVTPSPELIEATVRAVSIPVHVLIRPRAGDFNFTAAEYTLMRRQINQVANLGAAGVAVGVLLADGRVDVPRTRELIAQARPMRATFHRAFDVVFDRSEAGLRQALEAVVQTGADCLLTSGGAADVVAGANAIAQLHRQAGNRINIMAGGGLRLGNLVRVVRQTGVTYLHGSLTQAPAGGHSDHRLLAQRLEDDVREAVSLLDQAQIHRVGMPSTGLATETTRR